MVGLQQHLLIINIKSDIIAHAARKTANRLILNPAFLIKLVSKVVSL